MNAEDIFQETFAALTVNKLRSGLTMLGVIIGIASVIAMISIGQGAQGSIQSRIQSIGSNLILITPGFTRGVGTQVSTGRGSAQTLTSEDASALSGIASVKAIAPEESKRYQVTATGKNTNTSVNGTVPAYTEVRNLEIDTGSFITDENVSSASKVAVLGPTTRDDLFGVGAGDVIGESIRINHINFKIIGITKSKGGTGFGNQDDMIFVPLSTLQKYLSGDHYVTTISVAAQNQTSMAQAQQQITSTLLARHNISDATQADFQILNQQDIIATASSVTGIFTILLASIAGISLVVGGIGIMNMMLTTVTERTREIGLRKAIGATKKDISLQFLAESFTLTFVGGVIGVALGWFISLGVAKFANIPTQVSLGSIILAFGVSAFIGIVFGYYPARRAAGLNPIEALRYE